MDNYNFDATLIRLIANLEIFQCDQDQHCEYLESQIEQCRYDYRAAKANNDRSIDCIEHAGNIIKTIYSAMSEMKNKLSESIDKLTEIYGKIQ